MKPYQRYIAVLFLIILVGQAFGQYGRGGGRRGGSDGRANVPDWEVDSMFEHDIFTFARIEYSGSGYGSRWRTDFPAADLNFSHRLEELTSMKVNPDGVTLRLTDPQLTDYPFIFIIDPRGLRFSKKEAEILREFLLNGGFLMVDDFWGERQWRHFSGEMKKVFPDRSPIELPFEHPIFNIVFPLPYKPQVPSEDSAHRSRDSGSFSTWEDEIQGEEEKPANYYGIHDDKGRMMVLLCHNTDLSDGWEEEGVSEYFFNEFSEKLSYPLGINIIIYTMTH